MDTQTLVISKMLFFALYAATAFVARYLCSNVERSALGTDWFIASNLSFAAALFVSLNTSRLPSDLGFDAFALLLLLGHLLLHGAFMDLLESDKTLWRLQLILIGLGATILVLSLVLSLHIERLSLRPIWGLQYALIGWMLFRRSEPGSRVVGWFAAGVLSVYAACHFTWFWMAVRSAAPASFVAGRMPQAIQMVAHGAIAFAFLLVAGSRLNLRLEREAQLDELTGLLNRRAMRVAVTKALARCRRSKEQISLVMIDLDGLKNVNDRLGHDAGDMVLCAVGKSLLSGLRSGDDLARLGGDEFCLLLPAANEFEAIQIAERCRTILTKLDLSYRGEEISISASFGVAISPDCGASWEELLRQSDMALYKAKGKGKNRVMIAERLEAFSNVWILNTKGQRQFE